MENCFLSLTQYGGAGAVAHYSCRFCVYFTSWRYSCKITSSTSNFKNFDKVETKLAVKDSCLLGYNSVKLGRSLPTLHRYVLNPSTRPSVNVYQSSRSYNPDDNHTHTLRLENLKSYTEQPNDSQLDREHVPISDNRYRTFKH